MKSCFGYIRVSTQKQGEGVSLDAQKEAIKVFASRNGLTIARWFEEKETAAKSGRPVFNGMLKQLRQGRAQGVIIHKIDRSARNLRDWAMFSELPDVGVSVYVATESLDFNSRGGRLTADIQAVIAADYIRNLREECIKGMNGRLKQGLYPFKAPLGYLDQGRGKPKIICPKTGPLVKMAFELYASRQYSYIALLEELHKRGLRNARGGRLTLNGLTKMLTNQFYIGVIRIKTTGKTYIGVHEPLITVQVWRRVQDIRESRCGPKVTRHQHLFQGLFRCGDCGNPMVPELQKGRVYYRCKRSSCPTKTIREDVLDRAIRYELSHLTLCAQACDAADEDLETGTKAVAEQRAGLSLQIKDEERRLDRLQDLLLDDAISVDAYKRKQDSLHLRLTSLKEALQKSPDPKALSAQRERLAELQRNLVLLYDCANRAEKRIIVENVWPNRVVSGKKPKLKPHSWVLRQETDDTLTYGEAERDGGRTGCSMGNDYELMRPLFEMLADKKEQETRPKIPQWKYSLKNQRPPDQTKVTDTPWR